MILFTIKKAFFDTWDNLLVVMVVNIIFLILALGLAYLFPLIPQVGILPYLYICVMIIAFCIFMGGYAGLAKEIVNYNKPGAKSFIRSLKKNIKPSLVYALMFIIIERIVSIVIISYYWAPGASIMLIALGALIAWGVITILIASLYFLPVVCQLKKGIKRSIKISMTLFFDNLLFSVLMAIWVVIVFAFSIVTVLILPGLLGIFIITNTAVKLRLYKYDYLEENKEAKKIPWDELLANDVKKVGKRTLKGMIFPWKE